MPTCAVAVIVVAPAAVKLAGLNVTVASPVELVSAVPPLGVMVAMAASVVKVTTVFGTTAPFASMSVAFTVAGAEFDIEVTAVPAALTMERVSVGAATTVVPAGVNGAVVVAVVEPLVVLLPPPQPARKAAVTAIKVNTLAWSKNLVCKAAPSSNKKIPTLLRIFMRVIL